MSPKSSGRPGQRQDHARPARKRPSFDERNQHLDGLVTDDRFAGTRMTLAIDFRWPGFRTCWRQNRYLFGAQFRAFMDDILKQARLEPAPDPVVA